jgi:hypothetical protein
MSNATISNMPAAYSYPPLPNFIFIFICFISSSHLRSLQEYEDSIVGEKYVSCPDEPSTDHHRGLDDFPISGTCEYGSMKL